MSRNKYRSITLPEGLYQELEKYLKASKGHYITVSEIVREALRDFFKKLETDESN
jgi:metal-responsive CopG/Arc/MetJ family transcriptional regulator